MPKTTVAELMGNRGWSNAELARRANMSPGTVRKVLRGEHVQPRTFDKLGRALNVNPAMLTGQLRIEGTMLDNDTLTLVETYCRLSEKRQLMFRMLLAELASC